MTDYASIMPTMSMTTFIVGFIVVSIIGAALVELSEGKARNARKKLDDKKHLTPSQRAVERYYEERGAR